MPRRPRQNGYALLVVLLLFSLLALALAVAVPSWTTEIRRQREQAAIDYGQQYVMGIRRYYHKFGSYPPNLERLEETDNIHYLRRAWPDPLSKDGKWRFVHAGDVQVPRPPGSPQGTGLEDLMQPNAPANETPTSPPASPGAFTGFTGLPAPSSPAGSTFLGASRGAIAAGGLPNVNFGALPPLDGDVVGYFTLTPAAARRTDDVLGAPIIGVASRNDKPAIHAFHGKEKPSDWVFVYDPAADRRGLGGPMPSPPLPPSGFPNSRPPPSAAPLSGPQS